MVVTLIIIFFLRCRGGLIVTDRVFQIYTVGERNILGDGHCRVTDGCRWGNAISAPSCGEISSAHWLNSILVRELEYEYMCCL